MRRRAGRLLLAWGAVATLASGCVLAQDALDVRRRQGSQERLYFPSGRFLRQVTPGFREMAADWLWLRTTQYYGSYRRGEHDLRYFRGLLAAVTRLDPRFVEAYRFSALVLAFDLGDGAGAVDVLRRGILANPDDWLLTFELGFHYYVLERDFRRASVWFEQAAALPGASDFCRRFAAWSRRRAGDLEVSLVLWRNLLRTTDSEAMRRLAIDNIARCEELLRERGRSGEAPAAGTAAGGAAGGL